MIIKSNNINERIANLSDTQKALLKARLEKKNIVLNANLQSPKAELTLVSRQQALAISLSQEWWWLLEQFYPASPAYNVGLAIRFKGSLKIDLLEKALQEIVNRHEILRTSFLDIDGQAHQKIFPSISIKLDVVNLLDNNFADIEKSVKQLAIEEFAKPFDLSTCPLLRLKLFSLNKEDNLFLLTLHHIIADAISVGIIISDLITLYDAFSKGLSSPLNKLAFQYADFASWQRNYLQGEVLDKLTSYWKNKLKDIPVELNLATDRQRTTEKTFIGKTHNFNINSKLIKQLAYFFAGTPTTPFMLLLAVWKLLIYRYTNQEDLVVGTTVANRPFADIENVVGLFINSLPLRTDLSGKPTFKQLVNRVQEVCLEAYAHQAIPYEKLLEHLLGKNDFNQKPLFQTVFMLHKRQDPKVELPNLTLSFPENEGLANALADLTLHISESDSDWQASLVYNQSLFEESTIERMKNHFLNIISSVSNDPNQPILEISLLSNKERYTIITEWNKTETEYPEIPINEMFKKQALKRGENIAIVYREEKITYKELEEKSNQLANYLENLGIKAEEIIGVYLERTPKLVIALLGILKAGGVYLPLDPSYPKERLSYIITDSKAPIVITTEDLSNNIESDNVKVIILDRDRDKELIELEDIKRGEKRIYPENLAYAIYTSGSTGLPKGTLLAHRGLVSLISGQIKHFEIDEKSRLLQTLSITGDASLWEILGALIAGARLYLAEKEDTLPGQELIDLLNKNEITILCPAIRALSAVPDEEIPTLKTILAGGETCPPELINKWGSKHNLYNCYGPTEATITTTYFKCEVGSNKTPPIGKPFANAKVYILDKNLEVVPIGVVGEIYISGIGLARGYLRKPELTAEKFLPDPFSKSASQRMYKTGDLAKYLADGNIQFLGRADHQVKIRGYRIELDEIEEIIFSHSAVEEAVVIAEEIKPGDKEILAYVVAKEKSEKLVEEIRNMLKEKLPLFMIPAEIIEMEVFPRLLSGKVDRRSLPIPTSFKNEVSSLPETETEKEIAKIWANVLKKEAIDRNDDFFDLGGHSMLMVELASQLKRVLKVNVNLRSLFETSALSKMASLIDEMKRKESRKEKRKEKEIKIDKKFFEEAEKSLTKIEEREILPLIVKGEIGKVEAIAIDYLPSTFLEGISVSKEELMKEWFKKKPIISEIRESEMGRLATIMLPRFDIEIHSNKEELMGMLEEALEIGKEIGAKKASLTGLIPSATGYGKEIAERVKARGLPEITTGHAVTTACVIMSIERILEQAKRDIRKEDVVFLGLGSIGLTTLRLMLKCLPNARSIALCDVYSKIGMLEEVKNKMKQDWGYNGEIRIIESEKELPEEVYKATLIVGATNVENLVNVNKLRKGTIIVDDSAPHCFDTKDAFERFNRDSDILFTEGGTLLSPKAMTRTIFLPSQASELIDISLLRAMLNVHPLEIPSSNFSSLLSCFSSDFKPSIGFVDVESTFSHYQALCSLGFKSAPLNSMGFALNPILIHRFAQLFSSQAIAGE